MGRREVYTGFWLGNMKESGHFEDPDLDGRMILRCIFRQCDETWIGLIWFRIETGDGHL